MNVMAAIPQDHPLMIAWENYKQAPEFANTRKWALEAGKRVENNHYVDGSLWAAFETGWRAVDAAAPENWRDDPSRDERWNAGVDFVMTRLCYFLSVDPNTVNWDAATETLDGDVQSVIGNILRKHFGEYWGPGVHLPLTAPPASAAEPAAWKDVLAERRRQVEAEGWTPEHDDTHTSGEMARAAASYCESAARPKLFAKKPDAAFAVPMSWPLQWDRRTWWKPTSPRRDLIKAGALILAEIERLDRLPITIDTQ